MLASSMGTRHSSPINAEIDAVIQALLVCKDNDWKPSKIHCNCPGVAQLISNLHPCLTWKSNPLVITLKKLLTKLADIKITTISRDENYIADNLAAHTRSNPALFLLSGHR